MGEQPPAPEAILERIGFDPAESVLTERQAEVLALRERGYSQAAIADEFGTSRANVSGVEASARENLAKARETVDFAAALSAPVRVEIPAETDLYEVPELVYEAADAVDVEVVSAAPELLAAVDDAAGDAVRGRAVRRPLTVGVTEDGGIRVRRQSSRNHDA